VYGGRKCTLCSCFVYFEFGLNGSLISYKNVGSDCKFIIEEFFIKIFDLYIESLLGLFCKWVAECLEVLISERIFD